MTYVKEAFSPVDAAADCLPGGGGGGEDDITQEGRVILTDHGAFVLLNIYAPNAGEKPLRPRLDFKMKFLNALRSKCESSLAFHWSCLKGPRVAWRKFRVVICESPGLADALSHTEERQLRGPALPESMLVFL